MMTNVGLFSECLLSFVVFLYYKNSATYAQNRH